VSIVSIARAQAVDGSFPSSRTFVTTQLQLSAVPPHPPVGGCEGSVLDALWHTVLALAIFKKRFTTQEDRAALEFIEEKARQWALMAFGEELGAAQGAEADKALAEWLALAEVAIQ